MRCQAPKVKVQASSPIYIYIYIYIHIFPMPSQRYLNIELKTQQSRPETMNKWGSKNIYIYLYIYPNLYLYIYIYTNVNKPNNTQHIYRYIHRSYIMGCQQKAKHVLHGHRSIKQLASNTDLNQSAPMEPQNALPDVPWLMLVQLEHFKAIMERNFPGRHLSRHTNASLGSRAVATPKNISTNRFIDNKVQDGLVIVCLYIYI